VNNYYNEINELIKNHEVNKKVREYKDNSETLMTNWNIGRLIVEAQGGLSRAKYGTGLIKEWGDKFSKLYGNNYSERNLELFRKFYLTYSISNSLSTKLSWTHYRYIIPIKNENKRNYYINQVIINNLSVRELRNEIKNKSFERLSYKDKENIEIITDTNEYSLTLEDMIKDPILINNVKDINEVDERSLHKYIIEMVSDKFLELGTGFALIGHEYKIIIDNKTYKIDLLFFNIELNSYIVVEIKTREIQHKDISQLQFYVNYIDKNLRKKIHNKTIGLLIVKKNNKYVIEFTTSKDIYITTYKLLN